MQFPKMMGIAQGMLTLVEGLVRTQAIMHEPTTQLRDDAPLSHGLLAPLLMHVVGRQGLGAGDMHPLQLSCHPHPGLIPMHHLGLDDPLFDGLDAGLDMGLQLSHSLKDHRICRPQTKYIGR